MVKIPLHVSLGASGKLGRDVGLKRTSVLLSEGLSPEWLSEGKRNRGAMGQNAGHF